MLARAETLPRVPPVTLGLLVVTVAGFLVQVFVGGGAVERAIGLIPARVSDPSALLTTGGGQWVPAWMTVVSYMVLHQGWWHVATNMVALAMLGQVAEHVMGSRRFLLTYVASGIVCGVAIVLLNPHWTEPAAGASGALSGTLGAFLAFRLPARLVRDRRNLALLAIESACLLGLGALALVRTPSLRPDHVSSLMYHLIPFGVAWLCVRVARRCRGQRGAEPCSAA